MGAEWKATLSVLSRNVESQAWHRCFGGVLFTVSKTFFNVASLVLPVGRNYKQTTGGMARVPALRDSGKAIATAVAATVFAEASPVKSDAPTMVVVYPNVAVLDIPIRWLDLLSDERCELALSPISVA